MIEVSYVPCPAFEEPPNSWKGYKRHDGTKGAIYTCPNGHTSSLEGWKIYEDGTVNPSVDCSPNDCNFHDHIKLLSWHQYNTGV